LLVLLFVISESSCVGYTYFWLLTLVAKAKVIEHIKFKIVSLQSYF